MRNSNLSVRKSYGSGSHLPLNQAITDVVYQSALQCHENVTRVAEDLPHVRESVKMTWRKSLIFLARSGRPQFW
ncbi:MAG TPA: hypothetical protein VEJ67_00715 [Candidatus Cybelea sp.]|nr:hypothetical protein [Candidatus Cybelea sp.]